MKKTSTHIFVIIINFYLLSFFIGLILMFSTLLFDPINTWLIILIIGGGLLSCIYYEATRERWSIVSIGEIIISNLDKKNILTQENPFIITRAPLYILILVTLILNSNIQDWLSQGKEFNLATIIFTAIIFFCVYYGLKNFFLKPNLLPLCLILGGLMLVGFILDSKPNTGAVKGFIFIIYSVLTAIWLFIGLLYINKKVSDNTLI